jgi:hypothetical protein
MMSASAEGSNSRIVSRAGLENWNPPVNRRARGVLIAGSVIAGSVVVATAVVLAVALARGLDDHHCKTGFPTVISCTYTW